MKTRILSIAALLLGAMPVVADVVYDANGVGFVGKGDVQEVFGWNSHTLNEEAGSLRFQLLTTSGATWQCLGINPAGNPVRTTRGTESDAIESTVVFDTRRNRSGQVTGFDLTGIEPYVTQYASIGSCPTPSLSAGWIQQPTLVPDSLVYSNGEDGPLLQVSVDGVIWFDLPITLE
jgi:hypothetical protein